MDLNQTNSKSSCTFGPRFWKAFVDDRWLVVSTNPFEKYAQTKMEINLPQIIFGVKIKTKLSCHHLDEGDCHTWYTKKIKNIYFCSPPPPKIYLFDVWREFIYEINPLLSYLKWIRTWTPIQMAHTNNTHKPHTISYPNQTFCPIYITLPSTRYGDQIYCFFHESLWTGIVDKLINNTL